MNIKRLLILFVLCITLFSCTKNEDNNRVNESSNALVRFSVSGIEDIQEETNFKSASNVSQREENSSIQHTSYDGFETMNYFVKSSPKSKVFKELFANTFMAPNIRYRVELFEVNGADEKHIETLDLVANSQVQNADTVGVIHGKSYKWYAFSYNTADSITLAKKTLVVPMGVNKDFLYATGGFTISQYGNTPVQIVFQRKTARVAIDVDARGLSANSITALQAVLPTNFLKTGDFNIKDSSVSNIVNVPAAAYTLDFNEFTDVAGSYRKLAYVHSVQAVVPSMDINVSVPTLEVSTTNGVTVANGGYTRSNTLTSTGALSFPYTYTKINIPVGSSGVLKIDLLSSGIPFNGLTWAPAILYRHDATSSHRYRFYPHNNQTRDYRAFFSFRGYVPLQLATRTANPIDACNLVYPVGRWKTPSNSDFKVPAMVSSNGLVGNLLDLLVQILLGGNITNTTAEFNNTIPNNRLLYGNSGLIVPMNGSLPNLSILNLPTSVNDASPLIDISLFETISSGGITYRTAHWWSFDPTIDLSLGSVINVATAGSQHYLSLTYPQYTDNLLVVPVVVPEQRKAVTTTDLLNISLLNNALGIISSSFKNVRCVRNTSWNPDAVGYNPEPDYDNLPKSYSKQELINLGVQL